MCDDTAGTTDLLLLIALMGLFFFLFFSLFRLWNLLTTVFADKYPDTLYLFVTGMIDGASPLSCTWLLLLSFSLGCLMYFAMGILRSMFAVQLEDWKLYPSGDGMNNSIVEYMHSLIFKFSMVR